MTLLLQSRTRPRSALFLAVITASACMLGGVLATTSANAGAAPVYTGWDKLAVSGYDPVAYFTQGMPVKGQKALSAAHGGATWQFANEANKAAFLANPAKYMPQYGGYCAWAVSEGYTASADPKVWKIVGGKLYLNYNHAVGRNWEQNASANISRADGNWPKVLAR
jgi:YHS domain-containing protein